MDHTNVEGCVAKVEDPAAKIDDGTADEQAVDAEPAEATPLSAAANDPTAMPPIASVQPIAAPISVAALLDTKTTSDAAADGEELAAVDGKAVAATDGKEVTAVDGKKAAAAGGKEVAAVDGKEVAAADGATSADGAPGAQARGATDPKAGRSGKAEAADPDRSKIAGAAHAKRADENAAVTTGIADESNGEEPPDSKAKSEHPRLHLAAASNQAAPAQKPGDTSNGQRNEEPPAVDGGKLPIDVTQIASPPRPADHFGNVIAQAAPAGAANGASGAPVPIAGIAIEIAARAQAGGNRFEIRLDPPELGRIDVRLDVDRSGHVTSRLVAEKAETLDLLRRDAPELERALQQAGLKTSDNGLQFALRDQTFAGRDDSQSAPSAVKLAVADADSGLVETMAGGYGRLLGRDGGIDIRV